jgi:hypothetical protein
VNSLDNLSWNHLYDSSTEKGEKGGGIDVPTRSSGPLALSNLSQTSSPAVNLKVSIFSYFECDEVN